jgi:hypothetical protein
MMGKFLGVLLIAAVIAFPQSGWAQQGGGYTERLALIHELVELQGGRLNLEPMIGQALQQMRSAVLAKSPQSQEKIDKLINEQLQPAMIKSLSEVYSEFDRVYAENYTIDELKETLSVLRTDAGKNYLNKQRQVGIQLQAVVVNWSNAMMTNIMNAIGKP